MLERKRKKSGMRGVLSLFVIAFALAGGIGAFAAQARTLNVNTPSEEQIRDAVTTVDLSKQVTYATEPATSGNYAPGALSNEIQADAVRTLNVVRYIAGIPDDVTLNNTYVKYAQAGALVNYVNGKMDHHPTQPSDMEDELFKTGYTGTSQGNLYSSTAASIGMNSAIVSGWMADNGDNNLATVGHRRWCLNPTMRQTGFGAVTGSKGSYACMYAFDGSLQTSSYDTVVWPAQTMPTEYFGGNYPWSISSDTGFSGNTSVTLTRNRKGKETTWHFSASSANGHFTVNNQNYGMYGCVIFRPNGVGSYQDGDEFTVTVNEDGTDTLVYKVRFFSLIQTADTARIGLKYDVRGMKVGEKVPNWVDVTDTSITNDKIEVEVKDPSVAEATVYEAKYLYIKGLQVGETTVTVSLPNGASASCKVTVNGAEHVHDFSLTRTVREPTCYMDGLAVPDMCACGATALDAEGTISYIPLKKKPHTPVSIPGKEATCTESGLTAGEVCSVCSEVMTAQKVIEAPGHKEVDVPEVAATCTEAGTAAGRMCSVCEAVLEGMEEIPALGHTEEIVPQVDPTCGKPGTTQWIRCSVCDATIEEPKEIPATGEHMRETIAGKEPTCTEPGLSEGVKCSVCDKILEEPVERPALGHVEVVDEAVEATCTKPGLTEGSHCSRCEETLIPQEEVEALGHDYEVVEEALDPTCTEAGHTEERKCSRCGDVVPKETIDALGHELKDDAVVEPSCTEPGREKGKHCTRCDYTEGLEPIAALGHKEAGAEEIPPTCSAEGKTAGTYCERCGKTMEGMEAIGKLPHTAVEDPAVEATYDSTGLTAGSHCSVCGAVIAAQQVIPKLARPVPQSPAVGVTVNDAKSGGTYEVSVAGPAGTAAVTFETPANKNAASVTVPDVVVVNNVACKVTSIAPNAFRNNKKLKKVKIGANVTSIGANAFSGCKKLTSVTLGAKVTAIDAKAFSNCNALKKVTVPASVTRIGKQAFSGCAKLKTIVIKSTKLTAKDIGSKAFAKINKKATIKVPKKCLKAYKKLLRKKGLPASVKVK